MALRLERLIIEQGDFRLTADLDLATGARAALLGPSGAGKSTLLSVIAGLFPATSGHVLWDRQALDSLPPGDRPVTILFQDGNLFAHLTLMQNVALGLCPDGRITRDIARRAEAALDRVGLGGLGKRLPRDVSGGQQGRTALARALLRQRPVLLLDEPFTGLGPALKAEMLDLVDAIIGETGATLLMVTHDPRDAERLCPDTIVVAAGVAHAPRPTAEVLQDPPASLRPYLG